MHCQFDSVIILSKLSKFSPFPSLGPKALEPSITFGDLLQDRFFAASLLIGPFLYRQLGPTKSAGLNCLTPQEPLVTVRGIERFVSLNRKQSLNYFQVPALCCLRTKDNFNSTFPPSPAGRPWTPVAVAPGCQTSGRTGTGRAGSSTSWPGDHSISVALE